MFHLCMYVCSYPAAILEQTHAVYNAAWVVSDSYIGFLTFMLIPTSLFKFKILNSCLFTFCGIL